jgi:hypothetical protein
MLVVPQTEVQEMVLSRFAL